MPGLARPGNRVEAPDFLAGRGIERGDETADAVFAARRPDDHLVLDDERRQRERVTRLRLGDRLVPDRLAGLGIDRDQMAVDRSHEQRVAEDREPAVDAAAADARQRRDPRRVDPEHASGGGIERHDVVRRQHRVHDAVDDERRRFEFLVGLGRPARLEHPLQLQVLHVRRRDLRERAVAVAGQVPGVRQPVLRFLIGAENAVEGDLRACSDAGARDDERQRAARPNGANDTDDSGVHESWIEAFQRDEVADQVVHFLQASVCREPTASARS